MSDPAGVAPSPPPTDERPPSEQAEPEPEPETANAVDEVGEALDRALTEMRAIGRDVAELLRIRLDRARLGVRAGTFRLLLLAWLGLVAAVVTVVSAFAVVDGISGGFSALLGGRAWAGQLAGGALVLGVIGIGVLVLRFRSKRRALQRLRQKYAAPPESESRQGVSR